MKTVAEAIHYSKYHLHRLFTDTVGMTIHDYVQRRQLTEAAKLLVFSDQPIIEIALICGYESQQSFSLAFKAMYKSPPAEYAKSGAFILCNCALPCIGTCRLRNLQCRTFVWPEGRYSRLDELNAARD